MWLASVQNHIDFRNVWFVVHDAPLHLDPGVSLEGHLLRANHHLGGHAVASQQAGRGCGSLKAKDLFPVPETGHVNRRTDALDCIATRWSIAERLPSNSVIQSGKVTARKIEIK